FLTKLVKIDLSHNHIVSVTKRAFSSQKDLIDLNLENNKVNQINNMTFYGLSNLQVLISDPTTSRPFVDNLFFLRRSFRRLTSLGIESHTWIILPFL
ncbi:Uncharacterized protein FKW44_006783, partial [Caligus rogercresseyi]